jgi:hypothetical protein
MNDNRWLYFIVGGLLVVALLFLGVMYQGGGDGDAARVESSAPASPGASPSGAGTAAGASSGSSTSVTVEQKKQ